MVEKLLLVPTFTVKRSDLFYLKNIFFSPTFFFGTTCMYEICPTNSNLMAIASTEYEMPFCIYTS